MPGLIDAQLNWQFGPDWFGAIDDYVQALRWSPDGRFLAAASVSGPILVLPVDEKTAKHNLPGHGMGTHAIAWHPASQHLASGGQDARVKVWSPDGTLRENWPGDADWIEHVAWNHAGTRLAWSGGKSVYVRDSATSTLVNAPFAFPSTISDLAWSPADDRLAVSAYGGVWLWRPGVDSERRTYPWKGASHLMRWSPDARFLATADQDMTVHFWFTATGIDLRMSGFPGKVRALTWSPTSRYLATASGETLSVWDCMGTTGPEGRAPIILEGPPSTVMSLAYQHAGSYLAAGYQNGSVLLWSPGSTIDALFTASCPDAGAVVQLDWSPDDRHLAIGTENGDLAIYELKRKSR
ncbi:MAG TPA: WD40 repeat domain-containing protein [Kiritimatiellia bacterium]|nr:WD40 repeat domain-containing protein [Kiritimatiellia bacterium]